MDGEYAKRYPVQIVGSSLHEELWVPAEALEEFNNHILGLIEVVQEFRNGMRSSGQDGIATE